MEFEKIGLWDYIIGISSSLSSGVLFDVNIICKWLGYLVRRIQAIYEYEKTKGNI